jgi:hypothetical protein
VNDFTVNAVVICDEVRKEITNKDILIGVYGGAIVPSSFPIQIPIAVWMEFTPERAGTLEMDFRIVLPGNPTELRMSFVLDVQDPRDPATLYTPQVQCLVHEAGEVRVFVKPAESQEWRLIKAKRIEAGISTAPTPPNVFFGPPPAANTGRPSASQPSAKQSPSRRVRSSNRRSGRTTVET